MYMLNDDDKKYIQETVSQTVTQAVTGAVDSLAQNILVPAFENIQKQFDGVQKQFDGVQDQFKDIHKEFAEVKNEISKRPTEMTIQDNFDKLESRLREDIGESIKGMRVLDDKNNLTAEMLEEKKVFDKDDIKQIKNLSPFAVSPAL